jgi:Zn-dependent protease
MTLGLTPATLLTRLIVLLIGMPIHEWAHAWSAYELGDDTASLQGRLSLNPIAHLDLFGSLMILLTGFGWAKPVPVNPFRMRTNPRTGMALSAFAGPASNLLVAMICAIPFRLGWVGLQDLLVNDTLLSPALLLLGIADISVNLAVFNLLPFFPLDGEKVMVGVLPVNIGNTLLQLRPYSPYLLMLAIFILPRLGLDIVGFLVTMVKDPLMLLLFT